PTIIIYTKKKKFNLPNKNFKGVNVITYPDHRWYRRDIKTTNLLPNIIAEKNARLKNAYTAILIKNNRITEGCHSNIWIIKNNKIITHPSNTDILKGVTRTSIKKIIKKFELELIEKSFTKNQLYNADEVFLTSSGSFVTPIIKVDNKTINNRKIGNITLKIANLYLNHYK
ncbi:aminotransferase class IV, partial [Alphaproteobacteria bacterium]|nr:aminotransferase class IV [Alphaproteobacteria bacterium]